MIARAPLPQQIKLTVIAQDPSVTEGPGTRIVTEQVSVPAEYLDAGPRGARFHVVDYDSKTNQLEPPAVIDGDRFADASDEELRTSPEFRAQNVYAIAARTLALFEAALGRRLRWGFDAHQLYLMPRALPERNAFYAGEDHAIYFGYDGQVQTALSHDIVAHETSHAVLDGLRPRFVEPGLPDQPAFHEALGDIVALLSVFSLQPVVARLLGEADKNGRIPRSRLRPADLSQSPLFKLADELGDGQGRERGSGLRRSVGLPATPEWQDDPTYDEPHRRGEVVVAAVMRTMLSIWTQRLDAIGGTAGADASRVAEEGARAARQLTQMVVRAIDYMPPVELEFSDVVEAIIVADQVFGPDDPGYRDALREEFAAFGVAPSGCITDLTADPPELVYDRLNYTLLRADADEVARFLWENADPLKIDRRWFTRVESVRPSVRVGRDGLLLHDVVAAYTQSVDLPARDLVRLAGNEVELPESVHGDTELQLWGGGVVVFDQFGRAKYHVAKKLTNWGRQSRRLKYLADHGLFDTRDRLGFTLSAPRGQRFASLHVPDDRAGEDW